MRRGGVESPSPGGGTSTPRQSDLAGQELLATRTDYKKKAQGPLGLLADLQD
jgi:hypothetical protein